MADYNRSSRENLVSSFTLVKGALIPETYAIFASWDFSHSKRENLNGLREMNSIGARSQAWLQYVAKVINRRFEPNGRDRPLVELARGGCAIDVWKPILLWHITRDEFLLRDFLIGWLYPAYEAGVYRMHAEELHEYLRSLPQRGGHIEHSWSDTTIARVATALFKIAVDFDLLRGSVAREFNSYHLPEQSFLYILHALIEIHHNPRKAIDSPEWRMFFLAPTDVEHELMRLHQYRKVRYEAAGSIVDLGLPCPSSQAYAERMVA